MDFPINLLFFVAAKLHQENGCFLPFIGLHAKMQPTEERDSPNDSEMDSYKNSLIAFYKDNIIEITLKNLQRIHYGITLYPQQTQIGTQKGSKERKKAKEPMKQINHQASLLAQSKLPMQPISRRIIRTCPRPDHQLSTA